MRKPRRLSADELAPYVLDVPATYGPTGAAESASVPPVPFDWPTVFGNANPVEIEVGSGKGLFLVTEATARPDRNLLGIEIVRKYQLLAAGRVAARRLGNVRTCCADAARVIRDYVPAGSVAAVHVYFPDPWWKTRHKKRLLFTPEFAGLVARALVVGGRLHFASDVAGYFEMVSGLMAGVPAFALLPPPAARPPTHDMDYLTNFERKFRKEGRPIYRAEYDRRPDPLA